MLPFSIEHEVAFVLQLQRRKEEKKREKRNKARVDKKSACNGAVYQKSDDTRAYLIVFF